jgi:hypothetical protein
LCRVSRSATSSFAAERPASLCACAAYLLLGGCGSSEDASSSGPEHGECEKPPAATVKRITSTFVAPVKVVVAYQVKDTETPGFIGVVVGTDGFPESVPHKSEETPAPEYALHKRTLYTASGQAIRYSGESIPNVTSINNLTVTYTDAGNLAFDCVEAEL